MFFDGFWLPLILSAVIFYVNYLFLIDQYLFRKKRVIYILSNLVLILISLGAIGLSKHLFFSGHMHMAPPRPPQMEAPPITLFVYKDFLTMLFPVAVSIALRNMERWGGAQEMIRENENRRLSAEIKNLHYQLQPHFFFNSLNTIYALVDADPQQAKSNIHALGKLMRYLLHEANAPVVDVSGEIEFIKQYVAIMQSRLPEKTHLQLDLPETLPTSKISPLLFISLVENAIKHGTSATKESTIRIRIETDQNNIRLITTNNSFPKTDDDKSGSGVGISNLKQRLELLYPGHFSLELKEENDIYISNLSIQLGQ
jgi:two-component sensor histidine kinase